MLLRREMHHFTYILWVLYRMFETVDGHSGYEFSFSPFRLLPLSAGAQYHNFHHTENVGNFGSQFVIMDTLFGTNKAYYGQQERLFKERNSKKEK